MQSITGTKTCRMTAFPDSFHREYGRLPQWWMQQKETLDITSYYTRYHIPPYNTTLLSILSTESTQMHENTFELAHDCPNTILSRRPKFETTWINKKSVQPCSLYLWTLLQTNGSFCGYDYDGATRMAICNKMWNAIAAVYSRGITEKGKHLETVHARPQSKVNNG